tara:strand:- start:12 stop:245 length:234 start_codon:yes stop_codon:yes gene_type:complete
MKTPEEFTEEYTNLAANGIKPSFLYPEEQVYKLMQAYVSYVRVNDFVLDDVIKCEHGNTINPEAHDIIYCRKCWEES